MTQVEQTPIGNLGTENTLCSYLDDNPLLMNYTTGNVWFLYKSWVAFINAHGYRQRIAFYPVCREHTTVAEGEQA